MSRCRPSSLRTFEFESTQKVRTVQGEDGKPLFVAKDVAEALGYVWNGSAAIAHIPEKWRGVRSVLTPSGTQQMATLTDQGLYFFLGRSDKPKALPFQMWIAEQVVPAIMETGSYSLPGAQLAFAVPKTLPEALRLAADLAEQVEAQQKQLVAQAPDVDLARRYISAVGDRCLLDAATALCIPPHAFYAALEEGNFCYRRPSMVGSGKKRKNRLLPHTEFVTAGYLVNRARLVTQDTPNGPEERDYGQTMVTPKGMAFFHRHFAHLSTRKPEQAALTLLPLQDGLAVNE